MRNVALIAAVIAVMGLVVGIAWGQRVSASSTPNGVVPGRDAGMTAYRTDRGREILRRPGPVPAAEPPEESLEEARLVPPRSLGV